MVPGLGIRCVDTNPWVTGAETCELAMALDTIGDHRRALALLKDMQHLRESDGRYWTGWVFDDGRPTDGEPRDVHWPVEHTTYTAAAVILAVDALGEVAGHSTAGSGIMRGTSLGAALRRAGPRVRLPRGRPTCVSPVGSAERVAGLSGRTS